MVDETASFTAKRTRSPAPVRRLKVTWSHRRDVFEYIELFYNPKRKHTNNGMLSPVDYEKRQRKLEKAGV